MYQTIVFGILLVAKSTRELREMIANATAEHCGYAH